MMKRDPFSRSEAASRRTRGAGTPSITDVAAFAEALLGLAVARLLIRFLPYPRWRRLLGPVGSHGATGSTSVRDRDIARAVARHVARAVACAPFEAVCLPQAMAARSMLLRRGVSPELFLGAAVARVAGPVAPSLDLHAWLMVGDICVTGRGYARFSTFTATAR